MAITGQAKRRRIVINADAYIGSATSNVPVLVKFNSTSHVDLFGTGDDKDSVWFSSDASGQTTLYHEGVVFDSTDAIFYVKVDLSSTADTVIYFWYGTPAITGTESKANVWTNALSILHLESTTLSDSSGQHTPSWYSATGGSYSSGQVGSAVRTYSSDKNGQFIDTGIDYNHFGSSSDYTFIGWFKMISDNGYNWTWTKPNTSHSGIYYNIYSYIDENNDAGVSLQNTSGTWYLNATYACGNAPSGWHLHGAIVSLSGSDSITNIWDNNFTTDNSTNGTIYTNTNTNLTLGGNKNLVSYKYGWRGYVDEAWVFSDAKSKDWIKCIYNNVANYSTFITIDGAVTIGSSPKMIFPMWWQSSQQLQDTVEFTATVAPSLSKVLSLVKSASITLNTSPSITKVLSLAPEVSITSNYSVAYPACDLTLINVDFSGVWTPSTQLQFQLSKSVGIENSISASQIQTLLPTVEFTAENGVAVTPIQTLLQSTDIGIDVDVAATKVLSLAPIINIGVDNGVVVSQLQTLYQTVDFDGIYSIESITIGAILFDSCEFGCTGAFSTPAVVQSLAPTIPISITGDVSVSQIQTLYQTVEFDAIHDIDSVTYGTWILDSVEIGSSVSISATKVLSLAPTINIGVTNDVGIQSVSTLLSTQEIGIDVSVVPTLTYILQKTIGTTYGVTTASVTDYLSTLNINPTYDFSIGAPFTLLSSLDVGVVGGIDINAVQTLVATPQISTTNAVSVGTYQEVTVNISPTYSFIASLGRIYMETVLFTTNVYTSVTPVTTGLTLLSWNIIVTREGQTLNLADLNIVTHADFTDVMGNRSGSFEIHILNPNGTNDDVVRIGDDVYLYVDEESPATRKVFHGKITTIDYTRNSFGAYDLVAKGEDYGTLRFKQTVVTGVNDYVGWLVSDIIEDILTKFCPDITTTNVESADFATPIDQIRISWEYVGEAIEKLASIVGASFYVDEDDDLHFYDPSELVSQHNIKDRNIINAKIRRDASKAFDKIMVIGGKQKTLDQSETTVTHQSSAINDRQLAFSFTPAVTNLFSIDMHIDKIGIVSEDIQFSIVEDNSGAPTGSTVAYGSFSSATITDTPAWISSSYFDAAVDITKTYWVVIARCGANSSNTYKFSCDDTATSHKYNTGGGWSDATGILAYRTYYGIQVIKISNADTKIMGSYYSELPIFDNSIKDANTAALLASKKLLEYTFQTASDYVVNTVGTRYVPGEIATISTTIPNAGEQTFLSVKYIIDSTRIANIVLTCTKADDLYSTFAKMFADLRKVKAEQLLAGQASGIDYIEETEDSFTPDEDITLVDNIDATPEYDKVTTLWGLFTWA